MEKVVSKLSEESRVKIFLFGSGDRERKILSLWRERYPGVISLAGQALWLCGRVVFDEPSRRDDFDGFGQYAFGIVGGGSGRFGLGATHPYCGFLGWRQSDSGVVELPLDCRPCSVFGNKPCYRKDYACLEIAPETIVDRVKSLETLIKEK